MTGKDVKNRSLGAGDLSASALGPTGQTGATGERGPQGSPGLANIERTRRAERHQHRLERSGPNQGGSTFTAFAWVVCANVQGPVG